MSNEFNPSMTRRRLLHYAVTSSGVAALSLSQKSQSDAAEGGSQPTAPLDLSNLLDPIRKKHSVPALAGAVVSGAYTVARGAVGTRKYGSNVPVTVNDQFHIGSCTKAMTATLIGMLVEKDKLSWNTTLAQSFPDLTNKMHPTFKDVTVEMLLSHRGGFPERSWPQGKTFMDMHRLTGKPREQRQSYVEAFLREGAEYEPGTKYVYSNTGYAMLGAIAERTADTAWEQLMTKQIFEPLGMKSAGFGAMGEAGKTDQPWQHVLEKGKHHSVEPGPTSDNPPVIGSGGTVHCSIGDWAKFVSIHTREGHGENCLLKPETFRRLHTAPFRGEYAGGWSVTEREWGGGRVLNHAGSNNMNFAVVWMAPLKNFAVLAATNQGGDEAAAACDEVASRAIGQFL